MPTNFNLQSMTTEDYVDFVKILLQWIWLLVALYGFCHFGNRVTERYTQVGDALYRMAWYLFPVRMRNKLPICLAIAQRNVYVRSGANIYSMRELFFQVTKRCFSQTTWNKVHVFIFILISRLWEINSF